MKWKSKPVYRNGNSRIRKEFAILPRKSDDGNTYWLQYVYILEEWYCGVYDECWNIRCCYPNLDDVKKYPAKEL
jgi:hypothetical protein